MSKTLSALTAIIIVCVISSGCSLFQPEMSRTLEHKSGMVKHLDYPTCTKLKLLEQTARRDNQGRLEVTATWENTTDETYEAEIRQLFADQEGLRERGAYQWDRHPFSPGKTTLTWKSYSIGAVYYRIYVRKAD